KKEEAKVTFAEIKEKEEERVEEPKPFTIEESKKEEKTKEEEEPKKEETPAFNFDFKGTEFTFDKTNQVDSSTSFSFGEEQKKEEPKKEEPKKEEPKKEEPKKEETPFNFNAKETE